jgi:hypothetical protein
MLHRLFKAYLRAMINVKWTYFIFEDPMVIETNELYLAFVLVTCFIC